MLVDSNWLFFVFRLDNSTLWAVPCPLSRLLIQHFTECECLSVMLSWLAPSSGITWSANTRLERSKEKSSQQARSSKRKLDASETTAFSWDTWPEPVLLTCTKSTETTLSVELYPKCIWRWLEDIVQDKNLFRSLELASLRTHKPSVITWNNLQP